MTDKLKSCPFCGGVARVSPYGGGGTGTYKVRCMNCGSKFPFVFPSEESAVDFWNKRPAEEDLQVKDEKQTKTIMQLSYILEEMLVWFDAQTVMQESAVSKAKTALKEIKGE